MCARLAQLVRSLTANQKVSCGFIQKCLSLKLFWHAKIEERGIQVYCECTELLVFCVRTITLTRLGYLRDFRKAQLSPDVGTTVYCTKIRPLLECASPVWGGLPEYLTNEIQRVQNRRSYHQLHLNRETKQQKQNCSGFSLTWIIRTTLLNRQDHVNF